MIMIIIIPSQSFIYKLACHHGLHHHYTVLYCTTKLVKSMAETEELVVEADDFIDMEVTSFSNFFLYHNNNNNSHSHREFEFHMSSSSTNSDNDPSKSEAMIASPADELFYKGKLLPLHLPPRLQMVQKLLETSTNSPYYNKPQDAFDNDEFFSTPLATNTNPTPAAGNTPFESCHVSRELSPDEYTDIAACCDESHIERVGENDKKSWAKRLLLKKKSSIGSTWKASRAYLKSLFGKSQGESNRSRSYDVAYHAARVADDNCEHRILSESGNKNVPGERKKAPFGQIQRSNYYKEGNSGSSSSRHRRSFSVGLKLLSGNNNNNNKSSLALTSSARGSSVNQRNQQLKRCSSVNSERESSIQGAIAHCKKSHKNNNGSDRSDDDDENGGRGLLYSFSSSRISVCEDHQDRVELCRG